MKKGNIVRGKCVIGVFDHMDRNDYRIKFVKHVDSSYLFPTTFIKQENIKTPTKKEKEEYKKFLLKNGYSYYRGKVTKEL